MTSLNQAVNFELLERTRYAGGGPPFRYIGRTPVYEKSELLKWIAELLTLDNTSCVTKH